MGVWVGGAYLALGQTSFVASTWIETALDWALGTGSVMVAYFLFPVLLPVVASMLLDGFMEKISIREYDTPLRAVPLREELPKALTFVLQALLYNALLLPVYGILFFVPPLNLALYYSVNGYLLAKEFWVMVSDRMEIQTRDTRRLRGILYLAGASLMLLANIPPFTFITPLVAAAFMVHLGHYSLKRGFVEKRPAVTSDATKILPPS